MRQIEARVMHPAVRFPAVRSTLLERPGALAERVLLLVLISAFWGVVLFVALLAALH